MKSFTGKTLRWEWRGGVIELTLDHLPANEIGTAMLSELEEFVAAFGVLAPETSVCIVASARESVFSAGADLRELYNKAALRVFVILSDAFMQYSMPLMPRRLSPSRLYTVYASAVDSSWLSLATLLLPTRWRGLLFPSCALGSSLVLVAFPG